MSRVKISELKARLSAHLRAVQRGETLTVLDRTTPIARIVPTEPGGDLRSRPARRRFATVPELRRAVVAPEALARALAEERDPGR